MGDGRTHIAIYAVLSGSDSHTASAGFSTPYLCAEHLTRSAAVVYRKCFISITHFANSRLPSCLWGMGNSKFWSHWPAQTTDDKCGSLRSRAFVPGVVCVSSTRASRIAGGELSRSDNSDFERALVTRKHHEAFFTHTRDRQIPAVHAARSVTEPLSLDRRGLIAGHTAHRFERNRHHRPMPRTIINTQMLPHSQPRPSPMAGTRSASGMKTAAATAIARAR